MIEVYSDGSSSGRNDCTYEVVDGNRVWLGPGGYGWVLCRSQKVIKAGYGGHVSTTNNLMEMRGAIEGLRAIEEMKIWTPGVRVTLISDSEYTLNIASGRYKPTKNLDVARELQVLFHKFRAERRWVRGHTYKRKIPYQEQPRDVLLNHRCDQLARLGREANSI